MSLGLTRAEAARLLREIGPNALPERERASLARRLLGQLRNPLIYILLLSSSCGSSRSTCTRGS